jgi:hypothetical protein
VAVRRSSGRTRESTINNFGRTQTTKENKETDNMQEEKKKAPENTDEGELTKVEKVSEEVNDFVDIGREIKDALDHLMGAIESIGQRIEEVDDDDELAVGQGRIARSVLKLLAEQAGKLKNEAKMCEAKLEDIMDE